MARPPSPRLQAVETELRQRLVNGNTVPGARFLSNRALAERQGISIQSAHSILNRLCREGLLVRKAASGTYIPESTDPTLQGALLVFNPRARRHDSFGHNLYSRIRQHLQKESIAVETTFEVLALADLPRDRFPIFWEVPEATFQTWPSHRFGLILHRDPPLGMAASWLDSIAIDDLSGGVMAGQVIEERIRKNAPTVVVAGPADDPRSRQRVTGFQKIFPEARVVFACGWYAQHGTAVADQVYHLQPEAVFCCNDRLAEGLLKAPAPSLKTPWILGFDNAPIALELNLSTIAIPWQDFVETTVVITRKRLQGSTLPASRRILTPRPMVRGTPPV